MNDLNICPVCLATLPADYPFDHVAIDLTLRDRPELFTAMSMAERAETIRTGLARGTSISHLITRFRISWGQVQALLPAQDQILVDDKQELLNRVRELWEQDLTDVQIGLRLSKAPGVVNKLRARMQLPSKFGPGGRRKKVVQA